MYVSPNTNDTYILNTTSAGFVAAEFACNDQGGHLVTYASFAEQQEVEQVRAAAGHGWAAAGQQAMWCRYCWLELHSTHCQWQCLLLLLSPKPGILWHTHTTAIKTSC